MAYTLIVLNNRHNFTGRAKELISPYTQAAHSQFEKVKFVGGYALMRIYQAAFGKQEIDMPQFVQKKIVEGTDQELDESIGLFTSVFAEKIKATAFDTVDPIQRGLSTEQEATKEWLISQGLPDQLLEPRFREIYTFIRDSKLYTQANYYAHPVIFDPRRDEILIKVNRIYRPSKFVLRNFTLENRSSLERAFLPPFIECKNTGRRYAYLKNGLTLHDSEKDIRSYKTLSVEQTPLYPQLVLKFCLNGNFDSPEGVKELDYHTWCEIIDRSGHCYSFGLFAHGVVLSPDPTEFSGRITQKITFTVEDLSLLFAHVQKKRTDGPGKYHLSKRNCASFTQEMCSLIDIHASEKCTIGDLGGVTTQVRMYAIASIIAKLLREEGNKNKVAAVEEIATLIHLLNKVPVMGKALMGKFSLERSMESISMKNTLSKSPGMREWLTIHFPKIKQLVYESDAEGFSNMLNDVPLSALELKKLCQSILKGSKRELTYKIFNIFNAFYENHLNYTFCTPHALFVNVIQFLPSRTEVPSSP